MKPDVDVIARKYAEAMAAYLVDKREATLSGAYELGREMLVQGVGLLDLVTIHNRALDPLVLAASASERASTLQASGEFFRELLSPFEMTFRGYRDANQQLRLLNDDLARQKEEVESANRELESFSYSVSHDLRAPLRSIDGFSQALLEDCGDKLDAQCQMHLTFIREAAQHMAQLIDDLLELARVARIEPTRAAVDLTALAHRLVARLQAGESARKVDWVIQPDLICEADERLLELVLQNLMGNAWKFTQKRERARIEVGQVEVGDRLAFFVRDDGAGFDMHYSKKLFRLFQRLHSANDFEGTGVGLAIVQRIVHRHGGEVWADSEIDRGATFYFTLGKAAA